MGRRPLDATCFVRALVGAAALAPLEAMEGHAVECARRSGRKVANKGCRLRTGFVVGSLALAQVLISAVAGATALRIDFTGVVYDVTQGLLRGR